MWHVDAAKPGTPHDTATPRHHVYHLTTTTHPRPQGTDEFKKKSWALAAAHYGDAVSYVEDMLEGGKGNSVN